MEAVDKVDFELRSGYRRILSHLCRNTYSPHAGSCDRHYWSWRSKDISNATLQYAGVPLLKLVLKKPSWMDDEARQQCLQAGILAGKYLIGIQRRNGSFDQNYPHENHPGVVYDVLPLWLMLLEHFEDDLDEITSTEIREAAIKALNYAIGNDELYAEIANHFAHYAYVLFWAGKVLKEDRAIKNGEQYLERLFDCQSKEGWFTEYEGVDFGYLTRCLAYLARIDLMGKLSDVQKSKTLNALDFLKHAMFPDGMFASNFGSRNARIFYGYELLHFRNESKTAELILEFYISRLDQQEFTMPSEMDFDNFILLYDDLLDTWNAITSSEIALEWKKPLFLGTLKNEYFKESGIFVYSTTSGYGLIHLKKGGIWRLCDTRVGELKYSDMGYVIEKEGEVYTNAVMQDPVELEVGETSIRCKYQFYRCNYETLSPWKLLLLRILNLTVWRSQRIGDLGKRLVARRLFLKKSKSIAYCERRFEFGAQFSCETRIVWDSQSKLLLGKAGEFTSNTMASANYYESFDRNSTHQQAMTLESSPYTETVELSI